jgi:hypothetical protein
MFKGSIPALVTPFRDGAVDEAALTGLVEWHVAEGSHGIVAVGTTGETPTLTHDEHERVIEVVVKTAAGRIPVIAGAGSNNTAESIRLMRFAKRSAPTPPSSSRPITTSRASAGSTTTSGRCTTPSSCRSSSTTSPAARSST